MTSTNEWAKVAAQTLSTGKALAPDRFPKPSKQIAEEWAIVLQRFGYPMSVWPEAVRLWAMKLATDRMVTPRDLAEAAQSVLRAWEVDPERGPELREWREKRTVALTLAKQQRYIEAQKQLTDGSNVVQIRPETPLQRDERVARLRELGIVLRGAENPENKPTPAKEAKTHQPQPTPKQG